MPIFPVTDKSFEQEVLRSELPVLVDLYADWCAPCKQLEPILLQLSQELQGKLKIARVDVEHNPLLAQSFRVQSIPMLVLFAGGRPVDQVVGLVDKARLLEMIKPVLPPAATELDPKQLAQLLRAGQAVPVDLRDATAFARYRIPGAASLPAADFDARVGELRLADGRMAVLYARTTDQARELAEKARASGVEVAFLTGGFLHWEADGFEVEKGE